MRLLIWLKKKPNEITVIITAIVNHLKIIRKKNRVFVDEVSFLVVVKYRTILLLSVVIFYTKSVYKYPVK